MGRAQDERFEREALAASPAHYHVTNFAGEECVFHDGGDAAALAISMCLSGRVEEVNIDMVVHSREDAAALGRESEYDEDPEASVFERIVITAKSLGRIA